MDNEQSVVTDIRKENWFYTTTVACLTGQLFCFVWHEAAGYVDTII